MLGPNLSVIILLKLSKIIVSWGNDRIPIDSLLFAAPVMKYLAAKVLLALFSSISPAVAGTEHNSQYVEGTVYIKENRTVVLKSGIMDKQGSAYGYYNYSLMETGWSIFDVKAGFSNQPMDNDDIFFAAGYLEGAFTARQIWENYLNLKPWFLPNSDYNNSINSIEDQVREFFKQQEKWSRNMVIKYGGKDPYWRHVGYIMAHLDGLFAGYKNAADKSWEQDKFVVQSLNAVGDLIDLVHALMPHLRPNFEEMSQAELLSYTSRSGHCSALIKVTGAYEDIFMSHSSWFLYQGTNRIYKHYNFNVRDDATAAKKMSFSSYPGFLESLDDFYLLDSKMVLLQTTNNIFNTKLYDLVKPSSLLAWQRVRLANHIASSGSEWYRTFRQHNSGTYNNQYMVMDLKKVDRGSTIQEDALWVVEQIPGLVVGADQTPILRAGYWPSYNVPFYEEIYTKSGYPGIVKKKGTDFSYQLAPRAKIFRRDQANVVSMDTMKQIMRYNDYERDPYSEGNACNSICCRGDLLKAGARPDGCYDTKVSDMRMALAMRAQIISGPTQSHHLPPFSWDPPFDKTPHLGLPHTYDFPWIEAQPKL